MWISVFLQTFLLSPLSEAWRVKKTDLLSSSDMNWKPLNSAEIARSRSTPPQKLQKIIAKLVSHTRVFTEYKRSNQQLKNNNNIMSVQYDSKMLALLSINPTLLKGLSTLSLRFLSFSLCSLLEEQNSPDDKLLLLSLTLGLAFI